VDLPLTPRATDRPAKKRGAKRKAAPPASTPRRARDEGVNQSQLATLHGVTRQTVRDWTLAGCPRRDDGSYIVAETIAWRIRQKVEEAKRERASESDEPKLTEMNRKLKVEADLKELELQHRRAESIDAPVHRDVTARLVGGFASVAAGQLARFERRMLQSTKPAEARAISQDIQRALMEGAQGLADELDAEADALDDEESAA
jgi:phage terminase Nu1 subunit (DNA packaging protein)